MDAGLQRPPKGLFLPILQPLLLLLHSSVCFIQHYTHLKFISSVFFLYCSKSLLCWHFWHGCDVYRCSPPQQREYKCAMCSSSRQHIQCSAYIHYKERGCLFQFNICAASSVYSPQKCEEIISEVSDLRWIAMRAEINKAKVNIIAITTVESDTRWFPHHWRACVIISNTLY